jgi:hypothetical protein
MARLRLMLTTAAAILLAVMYSAHGASECFTVSACGNILTNPYTTGGFNACTVDINGNTCISTSALPAGATQISGNASGTTGAVVATLAGVAAKTTYICTFNVSASGTGAAGPITIAGLSGGSQTYQLTAPNSVSQTFSPCLPASAVNTAITITTTADASATAVNVNSSGYQF